MTAEQIIAEIIEFLNSRLPPAQGGAGGNMGQPPYRGDLFKLFSEAYRYGYMDHGSQPYLSADGLREILRARWHNGTEEQREGLIDKLCTMWEEWRYAWDNYPA